MDRPIYDTITKYSKSNDMPWHMPGHKRNLLQVMDNPYVMDITEIPGMDEYHCPEGIIKESQDNAASIYGVKDSWFLVNGSTVGILAAIYSCCNYGDHILIARNCHKSVYHAVELLHLHPHYIEPKWLKEFDVYGGISIEEVKSCLKACPNIKAVVVTSPTYEGVVSDVSGIAEIVHNADAVLITDEAHGAHFPFFEDMPISAVRCDSDIVIQSVHKTLPALTQTAIIHRVSDRIDRDKLFHYISLFQSTSPSYVLLGSIDYAIDYMVKAIEAKRRYINSLQWVRDELSKCLNFRLLSLNDIVDTCTVDYDNGKLMISCKSCNITGVEFANYLSQKGHIVEMCGHSYVLLMTSVMDRDEDYGKLIQDVLEYDGTITKRPKKDDILIRDFLPRVRYSIYEAMQEDREFCVLQSCKGRIAGDYVYVYPPGSPILAPGEEITEAVIGEITTGIDRGLNMKGIETSFGDSCCLSVLKKK